MSKDLKVDDGVVVACGQATILLEAAKKALDCAAVAVGYFVHRQGLGSAGMTRDDGFNTFFHAIGSGRVAVIGRLGQDLA